MDVFLAAAVCPLCTMGHSVRSVRDHTQPLQGNISCKHWLCISQFLVLVERMKQRSSCTISMKSDQNVSLGPGDDLKLEKSLRSSRKLYDVTTFCMFADVSYRLVQVTQVRCITPLFSCLPLQECCPT